MQKKAEAMVLASFAADALALGAHWIYDTAVIDNEIGRVDRLRKPAPDSFHDTKQAGEFTHYGDQALVLLSSIADCRGFDLDHFARSWQNLLMGSLRYRRSERHRPTGPLYRKWSPTVFRARADRRGTPLKNSARCAGFGHEVFRQAF